jgi:hypothetical protein
MAYCPECGREQKCGCEVCHHCGVPLVDKGHDTAKPPAPARSAAHEISAEVAGKAEVPQETSAKPEEEPGREASPGTASGVLPLLLLIMGCGILLIALVEIIHTTSDFFRPAVSASGAAAVKHLGYYLGTLLYNSSFRLLIGFALVAAGLLYAPPLPFSSRDKWSRAIKVLGTSMGLVGALCFLATILILIPGSLSLIVRNLLPSPVTSISVFLVMGIVLLAGFYLVMARAQGTRRRSRRGA